MSPAEPRAAAALRVGGLVRCSSVDWPGRLVAVVFVQGCPWRCSYCHNPHLQSRDAPPATAAPPWPQVLDWLERRRGLLDGVVFSGGEPTTDPGLPAAVLAVRALGFETGLHTAGIYPKRLARLLPLLDWVGLDIKAPLDPDPASEARHDHLTGRRRSAAPVRASLAALRAAGIPHECRTTAHPDWLDEDALLRIAADLAQQGMEHYVVQQGRPVGTAGHPAPPGPGDHDPYPSPATRARLQALFGPDCLRFD